MCLDVKNVGCHTKTKQKNTWTGGTEEHSVKRILYTQDCVFCGAFKISETAHQMIQHCVPESLNPPVTQV
jgi:hypothetical protein